MKSLGRMNSPVALTLKQKTIVVYGTAPDAIFGKYKEAGIRVLRFDSDYMIAHRKEVGE